MVRIRSLDLPSLEDTMRGAAEHVPSTAERTAVNVVDLVTIVCVLEGLDDKQWRDSLRLIETTLHEMGLVLDEKLTPDTIRKRALAMIGRLTKSEASILATIPTYTPYIG